MSTKLFGHDIDLGNVGQLVGTRLQNIADATAETTLAGALGAANEGLIIYRVDTDQVKYWDGTQFVVLNAAAGNNTATFFTTVNVTGAGTPDTVTHNLALSDRDAFIINLMHNNSQISLDVDSVDANSLTLTSLVPLTGVKVTIIGLPA
jgi:hypothetical protein